MKKLSEKLFEKFEDSKNLNLDQIIGGTGTDTDYTDLKGHSDCTTGGKKDVVQTDPEFDCPKVSGGLFDGSDSFLFDNWEDRQKNVEGPIEP